MANSIQFFDFHLHSPVSNQKTNEKIAWPTDERVATYLTNHKDLVAIAFSDHNSFDVDFYQKMQALIGRKSIGKTKLFPAIEVDVRREASGYQDLKQNPLNKGNVILVFDHFMNWMQLEQLATICKKYLHPHKPISFDQLNTLFKDFNYFAIAHANKHQSLRYEDVIKIDNLIAYEISSLKPNYDVKRIDQKLHHQYAIVSGSDCHNWNDSERYPIQSLRSYISAFKDDNWTFNDLKQAIKKQNNCLLSGSEWLIKQDVDYASAKIKQTLKKWRGN